MHCTFLPFLLFARIVVVPPTLLCLSLYLSVDGWAEQHLGQGGTRCDSVMHSVACNKHGGHGNDVPLLRSMPLVLEGIFVTNLPASSLI